MNFVYEQQGLLTCPRHSLGLGKGFFEIGNAGEYGGYGFVVHADRIGEQPRDARLARSRWSPKDHRRQLPGRDHSPNRAVSAG